ncbi:hypothetical protein, partial [Actinobacillus pleuropneumoniae]|uniref:hypothetical protein n=1 Tax=Actinobacillus pleuropneumoniae TaxID=715 RepID=UPI00227AB6CD
DVYRDSLSVSIPELSLPLICKISPINFPHENFSPQKIDFLNLSVCFEMNPKPPFYTYPVESSMAEIKSLING